MGLKLKALFPLMLSHLLLQIQPISMLGSEYTRIKPEVSDYLWLIEKSPKHIPSNTIPVVVKKRVIFFNAGAESIYQFK